MNFCNSHLFVTIYRDVKIDEYNEHWTSTLLSSLMSLIVVQVPDSDGVSLSEGWQHLVRVAPVRPEEDDSVKDWVNAGDDSRHAAGVNLESSSINLDIHDQFNSDTE